MEVRNCPRCGRLFNFIRTDLCPVCIKEAEEEFQKVRIYLRENPNTNIMELSEKTGVDEDKIIQWIREGRIESKLIKDVFFKCERCGAEISSGVLCEKCSGSIATELSRVGKELQAGLEKERTGPRFHLRRD